MIRLILATILMITTAAHAESYLCVGEVAGGTKYNPTREEWVGTAFLPTLRILIRRRDEHSPSDSYYHNAKWLIVPLGSDFAETWCQEDFSDAGWIFCDGGSKLIFSKKNLRFTMAHLIGYAGVNPPELKDNPPTPSVESGKCTVIP